MKNKGAAPFGGAGGRMLCALMALIMLFGIVCVSAPSFAFADGEVGAQGEYAMQPLEDLDTVLARQQGEQPQGGAPEQPAVSAQPAETVWKTVEATDTGSGFFVSVEGLMPSDASLVLKPLSEKAAEYVRGARELAEDEFFLVYQLCLVDASGEEIEVVPGQNDYKITVYFTEKDMCFGTDLAIDAVAGTLASLETDADNKAAEEAKAAEAAAEAGNAQPTEETPAAEEAAQPTEDIPVAEEAAQLAEEIPAAEEAAQSADETPVQETDDAAQPEAEDATESEDEPEEEMPRKHADVTVKEFYNSESYAWCVADGLGIFKFSGTKYIPVKTDIKTVTGATESGALVSVTGNNIPDGASVALTPIDESRASAIAKAAGGKNVVFAYDVSVLSADGSAEWQPDSLGAHVTVGGLDLAPGQQIKLLHIISDADKAAAALDSGAAQTIEFGSQSSGLLRTMRARSASQAVVAAPITVTADEYGKISFVTDGFSEYIGFTVDFYYGEYEFHLDGNGSMLLSELFAALNIEKDAAAAETVEFTDPSLVSFTRQDDGDWLITSLAPFNTEEKLTITFADGDVIEIIVKDAITDIKFWGGMGWLRANNAGSTGKLYMTLKTVNSKTLAETGTMYDNEYVRYLAGGNPWISASNENYWFYIKDKNLYGLTEPSGQGSGIHTYQISFKTGKQSQTVYAVPTMTYDNSQYCSVRQRTVFSVGAQQRNVKVFVDGVQVGSYTGWFPHRSGTNQYGTLYNTDLSVTNVNSKYVIDTRKNSNGVTVDQGALTYNVYLRTKQNVTYDKGNIGSASGMPANTTVLNGDSLTLPNGPKMSDGSGKSFCGWKSSADGNVYSSGASVTVTQDVTFTAQWEYWVYIGLNKSYHFSDSDRYHIFPNEPFVNEVDTFKRTSNSSGAWVYDDSSKLKDGAIRLAMKDSSLYVLSPTDGETYGVFDGTGERVKSVLGFTAQDYADIARVFVAGLKAEYEANGQKLVDRKNALVSTDVNWSTADPNDFTLIPYVCKFQSGDEWNSWYIDMVLVQKTSVTLYYDLNVKAGWTYTGSGPDSSTHKVGDVVTVATTPGVAPTKDGRTAAFLYWEDASGNKYGPGYNSTITMNKTETLTAVWDYNEDTGDIRIVKRVQDTYGIAPANQAYTFMLALNDGGTYTYTIYNNDGTNPVSGSIKNGGSFALKAEQYIIISSVPKGTAFTVTETNLPADCTANAVSGTVPAGSVVTRTVTNVFTAKTGYTVEHYLQNVGANDNGYTRDTTETVSGVVVGTLTNARAKAYEGLTAKPFEQVTVAADGSTVVKIYYDRNLYDVTVYHYEYADGEKTDTQVADPVTVEKVKYGTDINSNDYAKSEAELPEYTFKPGESDPAKLVVGTDASKNVIKLYYEAGTIKVTVTKIVSGTGGDVRATYTLSVGYVRDGDTDPTAVLPDEEAGVARDNSFRAGDKKTYSIPKGAKLVITETGADSYAMFVDFGSGEVQQSGHRAVSPQGVTAPMDVTVRNHKDSTPSTGVSLDSLPYVIVLAVAAVGVVLVVLRSRRKKGDD